MQENRDQRQRWLPKRRAVQRADQGCRHAGELQPAHNASDLRVEGEHLTYERPVSAVQSDDIQAARE